MDCQCEQKIKIFRGDDTNWNGENLLNFVVTSETVDLSTMTAKFIVGSIVFDNIPLTTGEFTINFTHQQTASMPWGLNKGVLQILDADKRIKTVTNAINLFVTSEPIAEESQTINVTVPEGSEIQIGLQVGIKYVTYDEFEQTVIQLNNEINKKVSKSGDFMTGPLSFEDFSISSGDGMAKIEGAKYGLRVDTTTGLGASLLTVGGRGDILTSLDVKSAYSPTGTDPVNGQAVASAISTKQNTIPDLADIRSGAALGETAVQPATMTAALATKQDKLTTTQMQAVDSGANSTNIGQIATNTATIATKQDIINDLTTIRSGAALGATALQPNDNITELVNNAGYITNTDYATTSVGGVGKVSTGYGLSINGSGYFNVIKATDAEIAAKTQAYNPIVPANLDYAIAQGITNNQTTLTASQKTAALDWLGGLTASKIALMAPYIQKYEVGNFNTQEVVNATDLLAATGDLHALNLDLSQNTVLKKLTAAGTSGSLANLSGVLVSKSAPFDHSLSPQLDVSYSTLNRAALVNLFHSMPYNVGYNVIGNPTIVDGIVTDFSRTSYLRTNLQFDFSQTDYEFVIRATPHAVSTRNAAIVGTKTSGLRIYFKQDVIECIPATGGATPLAVRGTFDVSSFYYVRLMRKGNVYTLDYSSDGINYTGTVSVTNQQHLSSNLFLQFGYYGGDGWDPLDGSIDIAHSYIKGNGAIWFRGTATMSKTCDVRGCSGTADLTAEDKAIVTDKGWSLTVA